MIALALFALPAAAQQDQTAPANPPAASQPSANTPQALKDFLGDARPLAQFTLPELRQRLKAGHDLIQSKSLDPENLRQVRTVMKDVRAEITRRQAAAGGTPGTQAAGTQAQGSQTQGTQNQTAGTGTAAAKPSNASGAKQPASDTTAASQPPKAGGSAAQPAPGTAAPKASGSATPPGGGSMTLDQLLADTRPASSLSAVELRQRFAVARSFMTSTTITADQRQALQKIAHETRVEMGVRAAKPPGQPPAGNTVGAPQQPSGSGQTQAGSAPAPQAPLDATAILYDNRPLSTLTVPELRMRIASIHRLVQEGAVLRDQKRQLAGMSRAARMELISRGAAPGGNLGMPGGNQQPGGAGAAQGGGQNGGAGQVAQGNGQNQPVPDAQAEQAAQKFLNDPARPEQMPDPDLRARLQGMRNLLQANQLSPATQRALRQKLQADREVLRSRMTGAPGMNGQPGKAAGANNVQVSINVILADRRPPEQLQEWELRRRIDVLRDAVLNQQLDAARRAEWQAMLARDRQLMHQRLMQRRQARIQEIARARAANQITVNLGTQYDPGRPPPPPSVFAAEADDQELADVLSAPPRRAISRRYTIQEVENSPDLRDALPRVEIDTIHFGFGESFVREEEVDNLDHVAAVLEKILAVHPREVFIIEGHTDAVGSPESNLVLSRKRAEAVKQALVDYYVIPPENLQTVGYGERFLKIPTPDPEPENRRVSIVRATPLVGEIGQ